MNGMRAFLLLFNLIFLPGCSHISYLMQAAQGQWALYNRERPIKEVLEDPTVSNKIRNRLHLLQELKGFVEEELKVKATANYTTFVDLKRPYVVWVVAAAEPFQMRAKHWHFPIAGEVPYLGFFEEKNALAKAHELKNEGFDVHVRGASAYSTLGYLRDPLLSSMISQDDGEMANLVFHETAHSQIYLANQSGFNEEVASFIGEYGEKLYIEKKIPKEEQPKKLKEWVEDRKFRRSVGEKLRTLKEELVALYESIKDSPEEEKIRQKEALFQKFMNEINLSDREKKFRLKIKNNAALLSFLVYEDHQNLYEDVFQRCEGDLRRSLFYLKKFSQEYPALKKTSSPQKIQELLQHWKLPCQWSVIE